MSTPRKVVLVSNSEYEPRHNALLLELIERKIYLFCAVGEQCELWEEVMDELCVGPRGEGDWMVTTTSHPGETVADVVAFAQAFCLDEPSEIEILQV